MTMLGWFDRVWWEWLGRGKMGLGGGRVSGELAAPCAGMGSERGPSRVWLQMERLLWKVKGCVKRLIGQRRRRRAWEEGVGGMSETGGRVRCRAEEG